ncbi:MAG: site-specific DNA-methyltransferase, partial [Clostridia bacterium]|nr:site-specific DNA-methyltransferase [Clostridia bacterium]
AMKMLNGGKQMRSDWYFPLCIGSERLMVDGEKAHPTQKPEALLYRVILSSTDVDDIVLDPFFGTGTTGAVAKKLGRRFIGIEREKVYVDLAKERIDGIDTAVSTEDLSVTPSKRDLPRVPFGKLVEVGYLNLGETLYSRERRHEAAIYVDGALKAKDFRGSIHQVGAYVQGRKSCNGWDFWYVERDGELVSIDDLREKYRDKFY